MDELLQLKIWAGIVPQQQTAWSSGEGQRPGGPKMKDRVPARRDAVKEGIAGETGSSFQQAILTFEQAYEAMYLELRDIDNRVAEEFQEASGKQWKFLYKQQGFPVGTRDSYKDGEEIAYDDQPGDGPYGNNDGDGLERGPSGEDWSDMSDNMLGLAKQGR